MTKLLFNKNNSFCFKVAGFEIGKSKDVEVKAKLSSMLNEGSHSGMEGATLKEIMNFVNKEKYGPAKISFYAKYIILKKRKSLLF